MRLHVHNPTERAEIVKIASASGLTVNQHAVNPHAVLVTTATGVPTTAAEEQSLLASLSKFQVTAFSKNDVTQQNILKPMFQFGPKVDSNRVPIAKPSALRPTVTGKPVRAVTAVHAVTAVTPVHAVTPVTPATTHATTSPYFKPTEVASIYKFPTPTGPVATVAIIELGGGYTPSELIYYWKNVLGFGTGSYPVVTAIGVDGGTNAPDQSDADYEVSLDIQVIGSAYPGVHMNVYFAPNTLGGFYDAIEQAITNSATSAVSISWGGPENSWGGNSILNAFNQLFAVAVSRGVSVFVASGDNGSSDGESGLNVDFPASDPNVIACGGTSLTCATGTYTGAGTRETAWVDGGGGFSAVFPPSTFQLPIVKTQYNPHTPMRAVPDVAANADPNCGYIIYLRGGEYVVGGTSAVAPLYAALHALIGIKQFAGPLLYKNYLTASFHDITSGSNGAYTAKTGYDCVTGMGSPVGTTLKQNY
jgi:kumamolisin